MSTSVLQDLAKLAVKRDKAKAEYDDTVVAIREAVVAAGTDVTAPQIAQVLGWKAQTVRSVRYWARKGLT